MKLLNCTKNRKLVTCSATMSTCTCAVSVTVLGVNSNQFWPVHTPTACSYALLSSISKLSLIHQSMQGRVQYGQIGVLTEDHRYCSEVRPVHSWTCTIVCQLCLQRFNHTLAIFIMQHYSAYGQIELSSWSSVMSSIPTRLLTSIIINCQRFNYSAIVFFRAHLPDKKTTAL